MALHIEGVYRDGVFHPDQPVDLQDNTRVKLAVETKETAPPPAEESPEDRERREVHEILVAAGVVKPGPVPGPSPSLALSEREKEIARKLGEIGSVYEIIREERDSN